LDQAAVETIGLFARCTEYAPRNIWEGRSIKPDYTVMATARPSERKKIVVDFSEIADVHRQQRRRLLNNFFEHISPGFIAQIGNDSTGIETTVQDKKNNLLKNMM
jgi:hypothetical protein